MQVDRSQPPAHPSSEWPLSSGSGANWTFATVRSAVLWTGLGWGLSRLGTVAASLVTVHYLGKTAYGELVAIQNLILVFAVLAGMSLSLTAARQVARQRVQQRGRLGAVIGFLLASSTAMGIAGTLALAAVSSTVATRCLGRPHLTDIVGSASLLILLYSIDGVLGGTLSGLEAFSSLAVVSGLQGSLAVPITVFMVKRHGLPGAVWALVVSAAISVIGSALLLMRLRYRQEISITLRGASAEYRMLSEFSFPTLLNSITISACYAALIRLLAQSDRGYEAVGAFGLGRQLSIWLQLIPQILMRPLVPLLSRRYAEGGEDPDRVPTWIHAAYMICCFPGVAFFVCTLRGVLVHINPDYCADSYVIALIITASAFGVARGASELSLIASGRVWTNLGITVAWNLCCLLGAVVAGRAHMVWGAAAGLAAGLAITTAVSNRRFTWCRNSMQNRNTEIAMLALVAVYVGGLFFDLVYCAPFVAAAMLCYCVRGLLPSAFWPTVLGRLGRFAFGK